LRAPATRAIRARGVSARAVRGPVREPKNGCLRVPISI